MPNRIQRVNALIKKEVGKILLREVDFPQSVLATITRVETSANLFEAKVYISVMFTRRSPKGEGGPEEQADRVLQILNKRVYDIQQALNKRLKMRPIPRIEFKKEEKIKEAGRIEELLEGLKKGEK